MKPDRWTTYPPIRLLAAIFLVAVFLQPLGCKQRQKPPEDSWLIHVGASTATVADFKDALEVARAAYAREAVEEEATYRALCEQVLALVLDELVLKERARELGLQVTKEELQHAVAETKKDYPDDAFEQMLIEYAVSEAQWEKRLAKSLLLDKVMERELYEKIQISPEDVAAYYEAHFAEQEEKAKDGAEEKGTAQAVPEKTEVGNDEVNRRIVKQLRKEKAQESFNTWMEGLRKRYTTEINAQEWHTLVSRPRPENGTEP